MNAEPVGIVISVDDAMEPALVEAHLRDLGATNIQNQDKLGLITCNIPNLNLLAQVQAIPGVNHARQEMPMAIPPLPESL